MRGNVIGYDADTNTGAISGHDGRRYDFTTQDWRGQGAPRHGDLVDFAAEGDRAAQIFLIEPEYVPSTWGQKFFSVRGRMGRSDFWVCHVLLSVAMFVVYFVMFLFGLLIGIGAGHMAAGIYGVVCVLIATLLVIWPLIALYAKRIHDRNKTAWLILIPIAAQILVDISAVALPVALTILLGIADFVIAVWFLVEFGCLRGTIGPNRYGADPVFGMLMRVYGHMVTRTR